MNNLKNKIALFNIYILIFSLLFLSLVSGGCNSNNTVQGVEYKKVKDVYGTIKVSGSSTMSNLMSIWCNDFSDIYHNTNCMVESFGSRKAPEDLENGNVDIAAMSEPMSNQDKQKLKNLYGYEPLEIKVAIDMIAVLVNRENPVNCITTAQLDGIYSNSNSCQGSINITTWGELNLAGDWQNAPIKAYGRTPSSGTSDIFKQLALCNGTYKKRVTELASSRDIIDFVSKDADSIGYTGAGLLTPGVKALKVGITKDNCFAPKAKNAISKEYPFTRSLYIYLRENSSKGMAKITREFVKYILSKQGQEAVIEAGLVNLPRSVINEQKNKITN